MKVTGSRRPLAALVLAATAAAAALAPSCSRERPAAAAPSVAVAPTVRTHLANTMTLQGEFHPYQDVLIHAKVSGYVNPIRGRHRRPRQGRRTARHARGAGAQGRARGRAGVRAPRRRPSTRIAHLDYQRLVDVNKDAAEPRRAAGPGRRRGEGQRDRRPRSATAKADADQVHAPWRTTRASRRPSTGWSRSGSSTTGTLVEAGTSSNTGPIVELAENDLLRLRFPVPEAETPADHASAARSTSPSTRSTACSRARSRAMRATSTAPRARWSSRWTFPTRTACSRPACTPRSRLVVQERRTACSPCRCRRSRRATPRRSWSWTPTAHDRGAPRRRRHADRHRSPRSAPGLHEGDLVVVGDRSGLAPGTTGRPRSVIESAGE